jgi:hypothetical protein
VASIALFPLLVGFGVWRWWSLRRKLASLAPGAELVFTDREARFVQRLLAWTLLLRRD